MTTSCVRFDVVACTDVQTIQYILSAVSRHLFMSLLCLQASTQYTAANGLYQRLSLCHGYLNRQGYCYNGASVRQVVQHRLLGMRQLSRSSGRRWLQVTARCSL